MARNQLFHMPDPESGRYDTCDIKKICLNGEHDADCRDKCHDEHQRIAVKGHGGKTYVLVDDHGSHLIVEHDLTPDDFDAVAHVKSLPELDCNDCTFEVWEQAEWVREVARLNKAGLAQVDRGKK